MYVKHCGPGNAAWYPAALELLVKAGADIEAAAAIRAARGAPFGSGDVSRSA